MKAVLYLYEKLSIPPLRNPHHQGGGGQEVLVFAILELSYLILTFNKQISDMRTQWLWHNSLLKQASEID